MSFIITISFSTACSHLNDLFNAVTDKGETVTVTRNTEKNVVIISKKRFDELEKTERNATYLKKLEKGLEQIHAGLGIVKTIEALEAMAGDGT